MARPERFFAGGGGGLAVAALLAGLSACGSNGGATANVGTGPMDPDAGTTTGPAADGGPNTAMRPDPAGDIFDDSKVHEVALAMSDADWQSILNDSDGDNWRHATFTLDGVVVDDVGVRPSGESSRFAGNPKMSMRVKFDAFPGAGKFGGFKEINLKGMYGDQSMMRDRLAYTVWRAVMPAPHEVSTHVVVNGDSRGLFDIVEVWDDVAIKKHFTEPLGPLYRIRGILGTDPYAYLGPDPAKYTPLPWEEHINHPMPGDEVLPPFLQGVASPTTLPTVADVPDLMAFLAADIITMDTDGINGGSGVQDHYQYYDPATGKFFILPWDPDNTFGSNGEMPNLYLYSHFSKSTILTSVRDGADLQKMYLAKLKDTVKAVPAAMLDALVDTIYAQIKDTAHADTVKQFPNSAFDWNPTYLKMFIDARYAFIISQVGN